MTASSTFDPPELSAALAERALALRLCAECTGRLFGRLGHGWTNPERAEAVARRAGAPGHAWPADCALCHGLFARYGTWVDRALRVAQGYEWHRFTCGSRWDPELLAREEALWAELPTSAAESARSAFNREWGKRLAAATSTEGTSTDPDVVFLADLPVGIVELTVLPVYVRGRYRKLDRTLPQTRWPCRRCRGRGCTHCAGTGRTYPTSVEELVGAPFVRAAEAEGTRFHGMGREDIDARMLGRGRPFVLELIRPKRRQFPLAPVLDELGRTAAGRVEVVGAAWATAADVVAVKEATPEKSYRVGVEGDVPEAKVKEALERAAGRAILQRTPTRVAHRRGDHVRPRRLVRAELVEAANGRFTLELRTESGTYVKEWVEGDGGRTEPNLSSLVGAPLKVTFLDVVEVHDSEVIDGQEQQRV